MAAPTKGTPSGREPRARAGRLIIAPTESEENANDVDINYSSNATGTLVSLTFCAFRLKGRVIPMKKMITAQNAPAAIGPYSHAVQAGNLIFTSGQIPLDPATGKLVEGGIEAQTKQVLANLKAVLNAAGADFKDVVKVQVFLADLADFQAVNALYGAAFSVDPPARSCYQVAALPAGAGVEIEAIAVVG